MKLNGALAFMAALAAGLAVTVAATAQDYPTRPITLVIPYPPGGSVDTSGRLVGERLSQVLGQPIIFENKGGAGGTIGAAYAADAPADGYTLLMATMGMMAISPHVGDVEYDPVNDFTAVAAAVSTPTAMVVNKDFPPSTVPELIEYARAHPGEVFFASSGTGGLTHVLGELFNKVGGVQITHVPYPGAAQAMTDLLGGRVHMLFDSTPVERVTSGQVKGLASMGKTRIKLLPDLPTIQEAGLPEFEIGSSWIGVLAPAGTPEPIVQRLSDAIMEISAMPEYVERIEAVGLEVTPQDHEDLGAQIRDDYAFYGTIIEEAGIRLE